MRKRLQDLFQNHPQLGQRLTYLRNWSRRVRSSEYHLTNGCNIRCKGCWFFAYDFDRTSREEVHLEAWKDFAVRERERGITAALLIGGEPTLYPERISAFTAAMAFVTISSNGLKRLPREGYEDVNVALTIFGGGPLDDQLRGHKPNGRPITGLFDRVLENYHRDDRAIFIYALTGESLPYLEETVRRIRDNGNQVTFNYYTSYGDTDPLLAQDQEARLLDEALRVRERFPNTVACSEFYIRTLITGRTKWAEFGYDVCPSISSDHPAHAERKRNGNPYLPNFNAYAADTQTVNFCCTSGHCEECRDSQAVYSWLMVSVSRFLGSPENLSTWLDVAESYWRQFVWSPYHPRATADSSSARISP